MIDKIIKEFNSHQKLKKATLDSLYRSSVLKTQLINTLKASPNRELALYLLDDAIEKRKNSHRFELNNLMFAAFALALHKNPEDVLKIWSAKNIDFDTGCGFDEQLLVGAGVQNMIDFLSKSDSIYFKTILNYIYTEDKEEIEAMESYFDEIPYYI